MASADVFNWVKLLAPLILSQIPATRKVAGPVAAAIPEAEAIFGPGNGADKLEHAVNLGANVAAAINAAGQPLDVEATKSGIRDGINTAFDVAKVITSVHGAPATPPA